MTESDFSEPSRGIDRRQLIKAGAWAAPVLAVTLAAPASATSTLLMTVVNTTSTSGTNLDAGASVSTPTSVQVTATLSVALTATPDDVVHTQTLQLTDLTAPYNVAFAFTRFQKAPGTNSSSYTYTITFSATGYTAPAPLTGTW